MDSNVGVCGYRLFCNENLQSLKNKIELETGKKARISDLQRKLSVQWKNLNDEQRQSYVNKTQISTLNVKKINTHSAKKTPVLSPFQNGRIKNILYLDSNMPKFTPSAITIINDAMASFIEQLSQLTEKYMIKDGLKCPIRPEHIVGGISQGDESVMFLNDALEYITKDKPDDIDVEIIERIEHKETPASTNVKQVGIEKITNYFHVKA